MTVVKAMGNLRVNCRIAQLVTPNRDSVISRVKQKFDALKYLGMICVESLLILLQKNCSCILLGKKTIPENVRYPDT